MGGPGGGGTRPGNLNANYNANPAITVMDDDGKFEAVMTGAPAPHVDWQNEIVHMNSDPARWVCNSADLATPIQLQDDRYEEARPPPGVLAVSDKPGLLSRGTMSSGRLGGSICSMSSMGNMTSSMRCAGTRPRTHDGRCSTTWSSLGGQNSAHTRSAMRQQEVEGRLSNTGVSHQSATRTSMRNSWAKLMRREPSRYLVSKSHGHSKRLDVPLARADTPGMSGVGPMGKASIGTLRDVGGFRYVTPDEYVTSRKVCAGKFTVRHRRHGHTNENANRGHALAS